MNQIVLSPSVIKHSNKPTATLLLGGDFCPIGRYEQKILSSQPIFADNLTHAFESADLTLVNLEAPLCGAEVASDSPSGAGLRAHPEVGYAIKAAGIDAVGLANNHIRDFGDTGVQQTMNHLANAGVAHTGAGMNLAEAQQPMITVVNGLKIGILALAERELNVASSSQAGSSWFRPHTDMTRISALRDRVDFLLVYVHAGHEFTNCPSPRIRESYRDMADAGADAVIGHHPHVIQGVERYGNAFIAYSLGNLVFDSAYVSAYDHTDMGYLVRMRISTHTIEKIEIIPYKLRPNITVSTLDDDEYEAFASQWPDRCALITQDDLFQKAWEDNVRFRWQTEYGRIFKNLSYHFYDEKNKDYARRTRNLFSCPTHVEMIDSAMHMLEQGKMAR